MYTVFHTVFLQTFNNNSPAMNLYYSIMYNMYLPTYLQEVCARICRHIVLNAEVDLKPHTLGSDWPTSRSAEIA